MGGADLGERPRSSDEFTHGHLLIRATGWPPYWPSALATGLSRGSRDQVTTIEPASPSVNSPITAPATRFACSAAIRDAAPLAGAGGRRPPPGLGAAGRVLGAGREARPGA